MVVFLLTYSHRTSWRWMYNNHRVCAFKVLTSFTNASKIALVLIMYYLISSLVDCKEDVKLMLLISLYPGSNGLTENSLP